MLIDILAHDNTLLGFILMSISAAGLYIVWNGCKESQLIKQKQFNVMVHTNRTGMVPVQGTASNIQQVLSQKEKEAYKALSKVKGIGLIHISIAQLVKEDDAQKIKKGIRDLRTQCVSHEEGMKRMIGEEAVDALMNVGY